MATKSKLHIKSWMIVYLGFAAAILSAGMQPPEKLSATPVSFESRPDGVASGSAFILPNADRTRRDDI